jgi:hypothetical protein
LPLLQCLLHVTFFLVQNEKKKKKKTTISLNQMIFHVSRNYICKPQGSKFKDAQNTSFFFFYVLWNIKTWNSKITPWKQTPQNQKIQNPLHTKLNSNHKYQTPKN